MRRRYLHQVALRSFTLPARRRRPAASHCRGGQAAGNRSFGKAPFPEHFLERRLIPFEESFLNWEMKQGVRKRPLRSYRQEALPAVAESMTDRLTN